MDWSKKLRTFFELQQEFSEFSFEFMKRARPLVFQHGDLLEAKHTEATSELNRNAASAILKADRNLSSINAWSELSFGFIKGDFVRKFYFREPAEATAHFLIAATDDLNQVSSFVPERFRKAELSAIAPQLYPNLSKLIANSCRL